MLVTNAVAALANGYGGYDSGEGTVPFTRLPMENGRATPVSSIALPVDGVTIPRRKRVP
jgi:hypothetical protein